MALKADDIEFDDDEEDWGPEPELPPGAVRIVIGSGAAEPNQFRAMVRLVVGGAAEGSKLLFERLEAWDAKTESLGSQIYHEGPDESPRERLRYAVLGLASTGVEIAQSALTSTATLSESAYRVVSGVLAPVKGSRLTRPLTRRYDELAARGEAALERWIDAGRTAEQRSRALARQAYDGGSTEVIQVAVGKLADEPAVRDLVTQQGTGMAVEMMGVLRKMTARADARWARGRVAPTAADQLQPAGFFSRLVALVLDVVIVTVSSIALGAVISLVTNFFGLGAEQLKAGSSSQILELVRTLTVGLSALAVLLFVPLYFIVFWTLARATPGKRVLGLRIVHDGQPAITWSRALWRYICYFLSAIPLFLGFFWVLGDSRRQGWHDKLAHTQVVYSWDLPASE